mmetsp:Transcript_18633/g.55418  ORF Transcript_18633/g.55418 Transcript_18633/m.55418 type:complete len:94 (+) Transcript_18633:166-447(+)
MRRACMLVAACAALASAQEMCISKKGVPTSSAFLFEEVDAPKGSGKCYSVRPDPGPAPPFFSREHAVQVLTGQEWYVYMLTAWVLTALEKILG